MGGFGAPFSVGTVRNPRSLLIVDFNGDGLADAMIHSSTANGVQFFLNNPLNPGSFAANTVADGQLTTSTNWSLAGADVDGDGDRDAVLVAQGLSQVFAQFFRNSNGLGTAWNSSIHATLDVPLSVDLLDAALSAPCDGFTDLAIANTNIGGVSLLLGDGLGGFAAPVLVATGTGGTTVVRAGDFNGDGRADLAVGNPSASNAAMASIVATAYSGLSKSFRTY